MEKYSMWWTCVEETEDFPPAASSSEAGVELKYDRAFGEPDICSGSMVALRLRM